ncbi:hypothetical protein CRE_06941 [Caenorhabditis remanei]|uniref:Uncharacterized protein n=1 Tax=Caenorhabditis remanei TaxID=31234 RepID=E3N6P9_CAERE|nr:hypothetical protein CRE_06941 [Caenorhabditis remanei]
MAFYNVQLQIYPGIDATLTTEEVVNYIEHLKLQLDYNFDNTLEEQQQLMRLFHAATL